MIFSFKTIYKYHKYKCELLVTHTITSKNTMNSDSTYIYYWIENKLISQYQICWVERSLSFLVPDLDDDEAGEAGRRVV